MSRNGGVFVEKLPRLPVGVENFEDIRREHFYYVDKTGFIEQLLKEYGKVTAGADYTRQQFLQEASESTNPEPTVSKSLMYCLTKPCKGLMI